MLVLSEKDIRQVLDPGMAITSVESAMLMYEGEEFYMPPRLHVDFKDSTYLLMPCFVPDAFGSKLVSVFPGNVSRNIPVIQGLVVLNNSKTGIPLAVMNGAAVTSIRTGAIGAIGVKYLTNNDIKTIGVIGAGIQGYHQAYFSTFVRDINEVFIFDTNKSRIEDTCKKLKSARPGFRFTPAGSADKLVDLSEAVITATTSDNPVIPDDRDLLEGKTFIGIGSYKPGLRELPDALFSLVDRVFIDSRQAPDEAGDLLVPLKKGLLKNDSLITLGKLINGTVDKGLKPTRFFKSVGMAIFDVVLAKAVYDIAMYNNIGIDVDF